MKRSYFLNSINGRLTLSLASFSIIILLMFSILYFLVIRINRVNQYDKQVENLYIKIIFLLNDDQQFVNYEKYEDNFSDKLADSHLEQRTKSIESILGQINTLSKLSIQVFGEDEVRLQLDSLNLLLVQYNGKASSIIEIAKERGFRDFGLEGKMREVAHQLEKESLIPIADLLALRRHEKDYFLRNDTSYVAKFSDNVRQIIQLLPSTDSTAVLLENYKKSFVRIVELEKRIGLSNKLGLRAELTELSKTIHKISDSLSERSSSEISRIVQISEVSFLVALLFTLSLSILLVYVLTRHFALPITKLTKLIESNVQLDKLSAHSNTKLKEIIFLTESFENKQFLINTKVKELKKKNRTLKKINSELDLFVYSTAHDLKAPLSSLLGLINIMRLEPYSQKNFDEYLIMMENSINKLNSFISDIIFYSKNNRTNIIPEKIHFKLLIENLLLYFQYLPNTSKIHFDIKVAETIEYRSDKVRIEAILRNLVSNAINYADLSKKQPNVVITVNQHNNKIVLKVIDNGLGIKPEHQDKIFRMFYRASENSTGSGLGLFIVKEMVNKLRGKFTFESKFAEGTTFNIEVPNQSKLKYEHKQLVEESLTV